MVPPPLFHPDYKPTRVLSKNGMEDLLGKIPFPILLNHGKIITFAHKHEPTALQDETQKKNIMKRMLLWLNVIFTLCSSSPAQNSTDVPGIDTLASRVKLSEKPYHKRKYTYI